MTYAGYSDEFRRAREQEQADHEKQLADMRASNERTRKAYLDRLEAQRQEQQARRDAELEQELAPAKAQELRAWLIEHPDKDARDFERIWPLVKEQKYTGREARIAREIEAQRRRLGYSV